jgi:glutamine amidotransferase
VKKICILDYGSGNVKSVYNILRFLNFNVKISNNKFDIKDSSHIILPGVGAFGTSMMKIQENIPIDILEATVKQGKPFLGICVGMQVLANIGFEFGEHKGLGWIDGKVIKHNPIDFPLPHIGWNSVEFVNDSPLLKNIKNGEDFYFVHSFKFTLDNNKYLISKTSYGEYFPSIIQMENIFGVQFHPEKSQEAGQTIFNNFLNFK